jgi:hypothetical protein
MSLSIDSRYITGIYALGQWFEVEMDTVDVDAFEFINWEERSPHDGNTSVVRHTDYIMGTLYPKVGHWHGPSCGTHGPCSRGSWANPSGSHGISFIDATTGLRVSFSLVEVRAFREERP